MRFAARLRRNLSKGFTLIELLVVIGILGILAAALVATIDPFEQLNKANDANAKNVAVEFLNASIRYYTTHNAFPWDATADGGAGCFSTTDPSAATLNSMSTCLSTLIAEGELKSGFTTATGILSKIFANESQGNMTMCFKPASKSGQKDPNAKYSSPAAAAGGSSCPGGSANTGNACYWCTQ